MQILTLMHNLASKFLFIVFLFCASDLLPATEYGIGISAMKGSNQSSPATMNARTGKQMAVVLVLGVRSGRNSVFFNVMK